nr:cytodhrome p450 monooxygenase [Quercus suber]
MALTATHILVLVGISLLYSAGVAIYRLAFHPLASIPGPKLAAVSSWWEFLFDLLVNGGGRFSFKINELHEKYGPVVRIAPNEVHVADPEWLKVLYARGKRLKHIAAFGTTQHHVHARRRAALIPIFSKQSLDSAKLSIDDSINSLCQTLDDHYRDSPEAPLDVRPLFLAWSTDSLTGHLFGGAFGFLKDPSRRQEWFDMYSHMQSLWPLVKQFHWIVPTALEYPRFGIRSDSEIDLGTQELTLVEDMIDLSNQSVQHKDKTGELPGVDKTPSLFQSLLSSNLPAEEKDPHRMAHEAIETLAAGSATTARVMNVALFHILSDSSLLQNLRTELAGVFQDHGAVPPVNELQKIKLLNVTVKEALRLAHVVTFRAAMKAPQETLNYGRWQMPPGTVMSMTISDTLTNPSIFEQPEVFAPERWLQNGEQIKLMERYNVPFGLGNRMCIGMSRRSIQGEPRYPRADHPFIAPTHQWRNLVRRIGYGRNWIFAVGAWRQSKNVSLPVISKLASLNTRMSSQNARNGENGENGRDTAESLKPLRFPVVSPGTPYVRPSSGSVLAVGYGISRAGVNDMESTSSAGPMGWIRPDAPFLQSLLIVCDDGSLVASNWRAQEVLYIPVSPGGAFRLRALVSMTTWQARSPTRKDEKREIWWLRRLHTSSRFRPGRWPARAGVHAFGCRD